MNTRAANRWVHWVLLLVVVAAVAVAGVAGLIRARAQEPVPAAAGAAPGVGARFLVLDVWVDSAGEPLAAYQLEVSAPSAPAGAVKVAGIEGGEPAPFRTAPYYDPAAMQRDRVVLGAFSLAAADQLPRGRVRLATVHCLVSGPASPGFIAKLVTAATADGRSIPARAEIQERSQP